jgi:hypothetical protein
MKLSSSSARYVWRLAILLFVLAVSPALLPRQAGMAQAQCSSYTQVTGTVTDPNGVPWSTGTVTATLSPTSASPTCTNGSGVPVPFSAQIGPTPLDSTGSFSLSLPPNSIITPGSTQWAFTFNISGVAPPFGKGPQTFSVTVTISGSSQSITSQITAAPVPALTYGTGSGSSVPVPNLDSVYIAPVCKPTQSNCYVAHNDGATDNLTAFTAISNAVNALTPPSVNTQKLPIVVEFSAGTYLYSGGLNFTIPVEVTCAPGTVLDYTGSAHAIDFGPANLSSTNLQSGNYTVRGCTFVGGASMTQGLYFNSYLVNIRVLRNNFRDFGNATSTVYQIWLNGNGTNWDTEIAGNTFVNDDNVTRNIEGQATTDNRETQMRINDNVVENVNGPNPASCSANSGIGFVVDGIGSIVAHNNFSCGVAPAVWIKSQGSHVRIVDNYDELPSAATAPVIEYGDPTGGFSPSTFIEGLHVVGMRTSQAGLNVPVIGPATSQTGLIGAYIGQLRVTFLPAQQVIVAENDLAGQIYNIADDIEAGTGATGLSPYPYIHTATDLQANWRILDSRSYTNALTSAQNWIQGFGAPASLTFAAGTTSCGTTSCANFFVFDIPDSQRVSAVISVVPTGTDNVRVYADSLSTTNVTSNAYECVYIGGTGIQLYRNLSGTYTQLGSTYSAVTPTAGSTLEIDVVQSQSTPSTASNTVTCRLNGAPVITTFDGNLLHGYGGIGIGGTSPRLTNFQESSY